MRPTPATPVPPTSEYTLRWNTHHETLSNLLLQLLDESLLTDVTLSAEGQFLNAHKVVLAACSSYFRELFHHHSGSPPGIGTHIAVVLKDVSFADVKSLVHFMYHGQVDVEMSRLPSFLSSAEALQVKVLADQHREFLKSGLKTTCQHPSVVIPAPSVVKGSSDIPSAVLPALKPISTLNTLQHITMNPYSSLPNIHSRPANIFTPVATASPQTLGIHILQNSAPSMTSHSTSVDCTSDLSSTPLKTVVAKSGILRKRNNNSLKHPKKNPTMLLMKVPPIKSPSPQSSTVSSSKDFQPLPSPEDIQQPEDLRTDSRKSRHSSESFTTTDSNMSPREISSSFKDAGTGVFKTEEDEEPEINVEDLDSSMEQDVGQSIKRDPAMEDTTNSCESQSDVAEDVRFMEGSFQASVATAAEFEGALGGGGKMKKLPCRKCGKLYSHYRSLVRHERFECGVGPQFTCQLCGKRYRRSNLLKQHLMKDHQQTLQVAASDATNTCSNSSKEADVPGDPIDTNGIQRLVAEAV
ncbi:unnamed protein product [Cyprideis torosa]|uniref:Uncharacterized protein n=1 Tax=Cyprideis torosa TaxID=163714 RepID=A0A7R8ZHB6_9CRUS|nr:unnamed protein product [Cyprideis torosa]CAG0883300.1 unnamed protein product [Cyprideis torosa]